MVGSISQHAGSLHNNLFAPQKEQAAAVSLIAPGLAGTENVSLSAKAVDVSRNMLASNFASAGHGEFRYLSAMKNGFAAEQNMTLSMKRNEVIAVFEAIVEMGSWHGNKSMQHAKLMKELTESDEKKSQGHSGIYQGKGTRITAGCRAECNQRKNKDRS